MAGSFSKSNPHRARKRVEADTNSLKRARDGSAFTRCEECNKDVPVVLIDMHSCSLDSKIKMHLESQVVEKATEAKKPAEKKRAAPSEKKEKTEKKAKKGKNPNAPKRSPTAFFLFMADFRKEFTAANPESKKASMVAKEGGVKWNSMSEEDKKPYVDKAEELKAEFAKSKGSSKAEDDVEVIEDDEENADAVEKEDVEERVVDEIEE